MKKLFNNPDFVTKSLAFYNEKIPSDGMDQSAFEALHLEFNQFTGTNLSLNEFDALLESIIKADQLADSLIQNVDYVVTDKNTIALFEKRNEVSTGVVRHDLQYANGMHEFLEEILRTKQILGPKMQGNQSQDASKAFKQYKERNVGFSGTAPSSKDETGFNPKK